MEISADFKFYLYADLIINLYYSNILIQKCQLLFIYKVRQNITLLFYPNIYINSHFNAKIENRTHRKSAIKPIIKIGLKSLFFILEAYKATT